MQIRNDAPIFKDIKIDGHVYTVRSHQFLTITAPKGTDVYAASSGLNYRRGDLLFQVNPGMKDTIVALN